MPLYKTGPHHMQDPVNSLCAKFLTTLIKLPKNNQHIACSLVNLGRVVPQGSCMLRPVDNPALSVNLIFAVVESNSITFVQVL